MSQISFVRCISLIMVVACFIPDGSDAQQRAASGALAGIVVTEEGNAVDEATVIARRTDGSDPRTATSDASGAFRLRDLPPGLYSVTARRIGFREATLQVLRVIAGQTAEIRVTLTASPTQLSTVEVRVTSTSIDASTTELARRIEIGDVQLVPMGRDASSLVDLVPGAKKGFVWGAGGDAANNYQLDGVAVNHPGTGGDFLAPSIDWIEALEVRGLGSGAEHGGFQGGIINAVTRTGTNDWRAALRSNYISPGLTSSNIRPNEEGAEQSMRRELSGVMQGPIIRDRLFYFVGGVLVDRNVQLPALLSEAPSDVRPTEQEFRDVRGIAKLTLRPGPLDRIDALAGHTDNRIEHADLNGIDDAATSQRVRAPTTFYELGWSRAGKASSLDVRIAGFESRESRLAYGGDSIPAVQAFLRGRRPLYQNAFFTDRVKPRSLGGTASWSRQSSIGEGFNRIVIGAEYTRGTWEKQRTRNGGLTWMPYVTSASVDPLNARTWPDAASTWGGEIRIDSEVEDAAVFIQDYLTIVPNLTITPGLRYGRWTGWLTPPDSADGRFLAARHQAFDPRIGVVWDISGRNDLVMKAHWGWYHQSMSSLFFDRAEGGNAYTNERLYLQGPDITDSRTVFTAAERDARLNPFTGFSQVYVETILNEAGKVENYRQPYVEQAVLSLEKKFGPRWKAEVSLTSRVNKDIVGLVDRNMAENYSPITNVTVRDGVFQGAIYDHNGQPLVLPVLWVSNRDLRNELVRRTFPPGQKPVAGYSFADINTLTYNPDIALTTVPGARRSMQQLTASVRTEQARYSWFGSVSLTNLKGNVAGLTGFSSSGFDFTAGPGVRRNERENFDGRLPDTPAFDAKTWVSSELPWGFRGGAFVAFSLGEHFAPGFRVSPTFGFLDSNNTLLGDVAVAGIVGQTILIEQRGTRNYPARTNIDLRLEKHVDMRLFDAIVSADLFNALGSGAIVQRNLFVNDGTTIDPTSLFGAPRRRVAPRRLQIGLRLEH